MCSYYGVVWCHCDFQISEISQVKFDLTPLIYGHPVNTAILFRPVGDRINGVPL